MELKDTFIELAGNYSNDKLLINKLWNEIEKSYTHKKRYYHNLSHLEKLIAQLQEHKSAIGDWHTVLFSVFYHDIVYNTLHSDNEEKSAVVAIKNLNALGFPAQKINECNKQILATKAHTISGNADTNLFTDADLSVLGWPQGEYEKYCGQIRREYSIYPDIIYKPGRKKVLNHFLQMEQIFKTDVFFSLYEKQARENLQWELERLIG